MKNNNHLTKKRNHVPVAQSGFHCGRGRRIRTLTGGFGDRCATINTIPLCIYDIYYISIKKGFYQYFLEKLLTFF